MCLLWTEFEGRGEREKREGEGEKREGKRGKGKGEGERRTLNREEQGKAVLDTSSYRAQTCPQLQVTVLPSRIISFRFYFGGLKPLWRLLRIGFFVEQS